MRTEIIIALMSLLGVTVGGIGAFVGNLVQKKFERNTQLHKIIAEKRFEAYENLIALIRWCHVSIAEIKYERYFKYSQLFHSSESYDEWCVQFNMFLSQASHLWDRKLDKKLHIFKTYIANLSNLLDELRNDDGKFINIELVHEIGEILTPDIRKLSNEVLKEASKFYSNDIYSSSFKSSISELNDSDGSAEFVTIQNMDLFQKRPLIEDLIEHKLISSKIDN